MVYILSILVQEMQSKDLSQALKTVLTQQTMALFGNKTAQALNDEYLSCHSNSLPHLLAGGPALFISVRWDILKLCIYQAVNWKPFKPFFTVKPF